MSEAFGTSTTTAWMDCDKLRPRLTLGDIVQFRRPTTLRQLCTYAGVGDTGPIAKLLQTQDELADFRLIYIVNYFF